MSRRTVQPSQFVPAVDSTQELLQLAVAILALSLLLVGGVFALMAQLLVNGWAHSFDSAIYIRNLWGLSHGDALNPIVGYQALSVHFNLVMVPLAWLSRVIPAWVVMSLTVALSYGATYFLSAWHAARAVAKNGADRSSLVGVAVLWSVFLVASPMVSNPFIFDVRPDVIAVPLVAGALFRARRKKMWDWVSVAVCVAAVLVREEFAFVVVAGAILSPWQVVNREQVVRRVGLAVWALLWIAGYWYIVRPMMNDGSFDRAHQVASAFVDEGAELSPLQIAAYKIEIAIAFCFGVGGLSLFGWRWLGSAIPGLLLAIATSRMQPLVMNFHYLLFCAPGLLVASVDGIERISPWMARQPIRRSTAALAAMVIGVLSVYWTSSAMPFGGRFRQQNFAIAASDASPMNPAEQQRLITIIQGLRAELSADDGVAMPYGFSGSFGWRRTILIWEALADSLREAEPWPDGVDVVVLPRSDWRAFAAPLTHLQGYGLVGLIEPDVAILRLGALNELPMDALRSVYGTVNCNQPIGVWTSVSTELCAIEPLPDGRVAVWIAHDGGELARDQQWSIHVGVDAASMDRAFVHSGLIAPWQVQSEPLPALTSATMSPGEGGQLIVQARGSDGPLPLTMTDGSVITEVVLRSR